MVRREQPVRLALEGLRVLVTRPVAQADSLLELIKSQGGHGKRFPLLEIHASLIKPAVFDQLGQFDLIIFVSRNAVNHAWSFLKTGLPAGLKVAAIGAGTAESIKDRAQAVDYRPVASFDSEGLLALEPLQVLTNQKVLIVRGQSGREMLAQGLRDRGAVVEYAEVYQRLRTKQLLTKELADVDAIVVSSTEALTHLAECAIRDQQSWVFTKWIVVIHPRIAMHAAELGFTLSPVTIEQGHERGLENAIMDALKSIQKRM